MRSPEAEHTAGAHRASLKSRGVFCSFLEVVRTTLGIRQIRVQILTQPLSCCVTLGLWLNFSGHWLSHLRNGGTDWVLRSGLPVVEPQGKIDSPQSACNGHSRPNGPAQGLSLQQLCDLGQITGPLCAHFLKCRIKIRAPVFRVAVN